MAGNFRGVLIFFFSWLTWQSQKLPPMKINDTYRVHAQAPEVGVVDCMTDWPAEQDP